MSTQATTTPVASSSGNWFSDIGDALLKIAPTAAGLFGGPLASAGVSALEKVFGLQPSATATTESREQAIMGALAGATPDQLIALRQADNALKQKMVDAGVQLALADNIDRQSARAMQTEVKSRTPTVLTYLIAAACGAVAVAIVGGFSPAFKDSATAATVGTVVGYLFSELKAVTAYWFGSSSGSADKNKMLDKALDAANQP